MAVRTLNLVLPEETVRTIEAKIAAGRYPDAEAMIQNALESLETEEDFSDDWIRREVLPALKALEADPSSGLTLEEAFANLDEVEEEDASHLRRAG
jgi:antitoxin ParD1/3/4